LRIAAAGAWPSTIEEAVEIQERLRSQVDPTFHMPRPPATVAGLDVAYEAESTRLAAAVAVVDVRTAELVDHAIVTGEARFPYVPGLFAFREIPALLEALDALATEPDVLLCDGQGIAHPRRFGLASHLGVLTGVPAIGVAKTPFVGTAVEPAPDRGSWTALMDGGETVGRALRTRTGVRPVFVSIGHRIDLDLACRVVLDTAPHYRIPEPIRWADRLCRSALGGLPMRGDGPPEPGHASGCGHLQLSVDAPSPRPRCT
jgi:deoxyribonuclease V